MSEREKIQDLNRKLHALEQRTVPNWERSILEVAKLAIAQEIVRLGRQLSRWNERIPVPVMVERGQ